MWLWGSNPRLLGLCTAQGTRDPPWLNLQNHDFSRVLAGPVRAVPQLRVRIAAEGHGVRHGAGTQEPPSLPPPASDQARL